MIDFPDLCRRLREKKNWGPLDLAEKLGLTRPEMVLIESGERPMPEVYCARLERLAERWHVSLAPARVVAEPERPVLTDDVHAGVPPPPPARSHHRPVSKPLRDPAPSGEAIRVWRIERGWTQAELAAAMGVSKQAVCMWEGDKVTPFPKTVAKLRQLMGLAVAA